MFKMYTNINVDEKDSCSQCSQTNKHTDCNKINISKIEIIRIGQYITQ